MLYKLCPRLSFLNGSLSGFCALSCLERLADILLWTRSSLQLRSLLFGSRCEQLADLGLGGTFLRHRQWRDLGLGLRRSHLLGEHGWRHPCCLGCDWQRLGCQLGEHRDVLERSCSITLGFSSCSCLAEHVAFGTGSSRIAHCCHRLSDRFLDGDLTGFETFQDVGGHRLVRRTAYCCSSTSTRQERDQCLQQRARRETYLTGFRHLLGPEPALGIVGHLCEPVVGDLDARFLDHLLGALLGNTHQCLLDDTTTNLVGACQHPADRSGFTQPDDCTDVSCVECFLDRRAFLNRVSEHSTAVGTCTEHSGSDETCSCWTNRTSAITYCSATCSSTSCSKRSQRSERVRQLTEPELLSQLGIYRRSILHPLVELLCRFVDRVVGGLLDVLLDFGSDCNTLLG